MSAPVSCPVVIEGSETSNGASVPDLPGCVTVADTAEEVETLIRDAIESTSKACAKMATRYPRLTARPSGCSCRLKVGSGDL